MEENREKIHWTGDLSQSLLALLIAVVLYLCPARSTQGDIGNGVGPKMP